MKKLLFSIAMMTAMTTASAQKMLVLYYSETGVTKAVAEELQKQTGADMEAVEAVEPYTGIFQETIERGQREMQAADEEGGRLRYRVPGLSYLVWHLCQSHRHTG